MKIPSKFKIFIWRALHGILPLKSILYNQHIGTTGGCPICNQGPEDNNHLLFQCEAAQNLWQSLGLSDIVNEAVQVDRSGSAVLEELLRRQGNSFKEFSNIGLKEVISVSSWYLWWIRRCRTHNGDVPPIVRCKMSILSITANAQKASNPSGRTEQDGINQRYATLNWMLMQLFTKKDRQGRQGRSYVTLTDSSLLLLAPFYQMFQRLWWLKK
jgi:hypothetical protein